MGHNGDYYYQVSMCCQCCYGMTYWLSSKEIRQCGNQDLINLASQIQGFFQNDFDMKSEMAKCFSQDEDELNSSDATLELFGQFSLEYNNPSLKNTDHDDLFDFTSDDEEETSSEKHT